MYYHKDVQRFLEVFSCADKPPSIELLCMWIKWCIFRAAGARIPCDTIMTNCGLMISQHYSIAVSALPRVLTSKHAPFGVTLSPSSPRGEPYRSLYLRSAVTGSSRSRGAPAARCSSAAESADRRRACHPATRRTTVRCESWASSACCPTAAGWGRRSPRAESCDRATMANRQTTSRP